MPGSSSACQCLYERFRAFAFAFCWFSRSVLPALAGPFEDAVGKFANDDFSDTEEAVGVLAASGNPLAYTIISALQDGRLMADPDSKKVYVNPAGRQDHRCRDRRAGRPACRDSAAAVRAQ